MPSKRFAAAFPQPKFNPAVKSQGSMTTKTGKRKRCKQSWNYGHGSWRPDTDTACASRGSSMVPTPPSTPPPAWKRGCITTQHWLQQGNRSDRAVTDADCADPSITLQPSPPSTPPPFYLLDHRNKTAPPTYPPFSYAQWAKQRTAPWASRSKKAV